MKVKYFADTDTAYIELSHSTVAETKDINENILIDLDEKGNVVGITIEHARALADIQEVSFQQISAKAA